MSGNRTNLKICDACSSPAAGREEPRNHFNSSKQKRLESSDGEMTGTTTADFFTSSLSLVRYLSSGDNPSSINTSTLPRRSRRFVSSSLLKRETHPLRRG